MPAYAKILISVNGGANQSGGIEVPSAAVIRHRGESTVGWLRQRWEYLDYPEGWATPAGWTLEAATGIIYSTAVEPDDITLPADAVLWGKWFPRLMINEQLDTDQRLDGSLLDDTTILSMLSPNGLRDTAARETSQFTTATTRFKNFLRDYQRTLRTIDPLLAGDAAPAGTCTLEQFGAVGDGVTNDTAAWTAALDAVKAGTYGALLLGAKTYLVDNYTWDGGAGNGGAIIGQGPKSVLKYRIANPDALKALIFARNIDSLLLKDFTIAGDGVLSQTGVLLGLADSTAPQKCTIDGVHFKDLALKPVHTTNAPNPTSQVCIMKNCRLFNAGSVGTGIVGGAQMILDGVNTSGFAIGWQFSAGNLTAVGCVTDNNDVGLQLVAAGNDGHGTVTGCTFNHNTTSLEVQDIANGMTFSGCHFYACSLSFDNVGLVNFFGCSLRPVNMDFTDPAKVRFVSCGLETSVFVACNIAATCAVEFIDCRDLDGTAPSFVRDFVQVPFTFAADANDTLTMQESVAEIVRIQTGVLSAGRDLTSALAPAGQESRYILIDNGETEDVTFKWSAGTGVVVAAGTRALIGSDGTNAIQL